MRRVGLLALLVVGWPSAGGLAQKWAEDMFSTTSHDFGGVPRAAKVEHRFVATNLYVPDVHVAGVRSSCGCTTPRIENESLKSHETGAVVAAFNTDSFLGQHGATLTVTIDKPSYAEVRLTVRGYIRTDVVLNPSLVALGSIEQGTGMEKKVALEYAGRDDWRIVEAKSGLPFLSATAKETARGGGRVSYELLVKLADNAPPGYVSERLMLVTNETGGREVPVAVEGVVVAPLSVHPTAVHLGVIEPGQTARRQLIVRGMQPLRIVKLECPDAALTFEVDQEAKPLHVVPLTYTAGATPGRIATTIRLTTDLAMGGIVEIPVAGEVVAPAPSKPTDAAASQ